MENYSEDAIRRDQIYMQRDCWFANNVALLETREGMEPPEDYVMVVGREIEEG